MRFIIAPFRSLLLIILYASRRKWAIITHLIFFIPLFNGRNKRYLRSVSTAKSVLHRLLWWFLVIITKLLDLIGFCEVFELFYIWIKPNLRPLTDYEEEQLRLIYGDGFHYSMVKVDENSGFARIGARYANKTKLGLVSGRIIHFTRPLDCKTNQSDMEWLVHEYMHVFQMNKLGSQYILEALYAQHTNGYSPGKPEELLKWPKLKYFNLEQQAEIARYLYRDIRIDKNDSPYRIYHEQILMEQL